MEDKRTADYVSHLFEMPKEVLIKSPILKVLGTKEIQIENFNRLKGYESHCIKIHTNEGTIMVEGKNLIAKSMDSEMLKIKGHLTAIYFVD